MVLFIFFCFSCKWRMACWRWRWKHLVSLRWSNNWPWALWKHFGIRIGSLRNRPLRPIKSVNRRDAALYAKIHEPKTVAATSTIEILTLEVSDKLNLESKTETAASPSAEDSEKKHQSRGGKGLVRDESVKLDKEALKRSVIQMEIFISFKPLPRLF